MFVLFFGGVTTAYWAEARGNPIHAARGIDVAASATNPGGNMEGKEVRFGIANSALFATVTTDASCGAVNAMHDSFTPIGGLVPLVNIQLGEVIFGGVGAGLYGMLVMVVLTVFIAGLMVGRTPEYLGKKIQAREVQMAMLYVLVFPAPILVDDRDLGARCPPGSRDSTTPGRTGCRRFSTRSGRRPATTAARSPGSPGSHVLLQHAARRRDALRPLRDDRPDARARAASSREEDRAPSRRGPFRSRARSSSCSSSA